MSSVIASSANIAARVGAHRAARPARSARAAAAAPAGPFRSATASFASGNAAGLSRRSSRSAAPAAKALPPVVASSSATSIKIIIQGRKLEVTPAIRSHVEEKLTKALSHFEGNIKEVDVKLSVRGGDAGAGAKEQRTEVTLYTLKHGVVRAEDVEENLYASVDLVCDKLNRKLRKLKEKAIDRGTWSSRGGKAGQTHLYEVLSSTEVVDDLELDRVAQLPKEVVRAKHIQLEPMTVDEAAEQMESVGHDFYMFLEIESNVIQVVYKRTQHGYGVLIPRD